MIDASATASVDGLDASRRCRRAAARPARPRCRARAPRRSCHRSRRRRCSWRPRASISCSRAACARPRARTARAADVARVGQRRAAGRSDRRCAPGSGAAAPPAKARDLLAAEREEDAARLFAERRHRLRDVVDLGPAVALRPAARPGGTSAKSGTPVAAAATRRWREICAAEGMGGVDQQVDAVARRGSRRGRSAPPKPPIRTGTG